MPPREQKKTAMIWWSDDFIGWVVDTPYSKAFVDELKYNTNYTSRWEPGKKVWIVQEPMLDTARRLLEKHFKDYVFMPRKAAVMPAGGKFELNAGAFLKLMTMDEINAAVKRAQMRLHPDRPGGDGAKSARLNELWELLKKEL